MVNVCFPSNVSSVKSGALSPRLGALRPIIPGGGPSRGLSTGWLEDGLFFFLEEFFAATSGPVARPVANTLNARIVATSNRTFHTIPPNGLRADLTRLIGPR